MFRKLFAKAPKPDSQESLEDERLDVDKSEYRLSKGLNGEKAGEGGQGKVYEAQHRRTGQRLACKCISVVSPTEAMGDGLHRLEDGVKEALNMDVLAGGPHIVKIRDLEYIETKRWSEIRIYTDLYPGGDMGKLIDDCARRRVTIPENAIVDIARQIAEAISFCHARGFWHRDLKPANVVFETKWSNPEFQPAPNVVVIDFGIARFAGTATSISRTRIYTPGYGTPEMLQSKTSSAEGDIFNFGQILYCLMVLSTPSPFSSMDDLSPSSLPSMYSSSLRDLVSQMLRSQRRERPRIGEIQRRLQSISTDLKKAPVFNVDDLARIINPKRWDLNESPGKTGWRDKRRAKAETTCLFCGQTFSSRSRLFDHLNDLPWHQV